MIGPHRIVGAVGLSSLLVLAAACDSPSGPSGPVPPGADDDTPPTAPAGPDAAPPAPVSHSLKVLTYNVAGLPQGISGSDPAINTAQMSPLLNDYDLVLVQEDFQYHDDLAAMADHPYQSEPMETDLIDSMGDGLNLFSRVPFTGFERHAWEDCNGLFDSSNDCLTPKGFTVTTATVEGLDVDLYDLHFDAGRGSGDREARAAQIDQLATFIHARGSSRALVIAGDTNLKDEDDEAILVGMMAKIGVTDACRSLSCSEPNRIDRVFTRDGDAVTVAAAAWGLDERFVDDDGEPLSDHEAVAVDITLTAR